MNTNLIKKIGASMIFPALALSLLLFSPRILSNVDNNEAFVVAQDTTQQDSPIETFARFECFKKSVISEFFIQHFSF